MKILEKEFERLQVYKHQGAENAQYGLEVIFKPPCSFPFVILTNLRHLDYAGDLRQSSESNRNTS